MNYFYSIICSWFLVSIIMFFHLINKTAKIGLIMKEEHGVDKESVDSFYRSMMPKTFIVSIWNGCLFGIPIGVIIGIII